MKTVIIILLIVGIMDALILWACAKVAKEADEAMRKMEIKKKGE